MSKSSAVLPRPSKRYMRDSRWVTKNIARLSRKYANRWIAVCNERVLADGADRREALVAARRKAESTDLVCRYIDDGTSIFTVISIMKRCSR